MIYFTINHLERRLQVIKAIIRWTEISKLADNRAVTLERNARLHEKTAYAENFKTKGKNFIQNPSSFKHDPMDRVLVPLIDRLAEIHEPDLRNLRPHLSEGLS